MEIKGIDVSAWQKNINWETAANYGMGFAILRITEAGNVTDKYFEKIMKRARSITFQQEYINTLTQ